MTYIFVGIFIGIFTINFVNETTAVPTNIRLGPKGLPGKKTA